MVNTSEKQTPMMQQYFEVRRGLPRDTLLLFRLGDFFELFFDDAVVASRFHNVVCALMCGVPTVAVGYGDKHRVLMERFGLGRFSHEIRSLEVDRLQRSLEELLGQGDRLTPHLLEVAASERRALLGLLSEVDELISSTRDRSVKQSRT